MKLVLADCLETSFAEAFHQQKMSMLLSFFYCKNGVSKGKTLMKMLETARAKGYKEPFYLDSGVFSARKKGQTISVEALIAFYKEHRDKIDYVFNMDEGSPQQQLENCRKMKIAGCPVVGIYHADMPFDFLETMAEIGPYVAISFFKAPGTCRRAKIFSHLEKVFAHIRRRGLQKLPIHLLGTDIAEVLLRYPVYSCDTSKFVRNVFLGYRGHFSLSEGYPRIRSKKAKAYQCREDAEAFAYSLKTLRERKGAGVKHEMFLRYAMQTILTRIWAKRGVVWDDAEILKGVKQL